MGAACASRGPPVSSDCVSCARRQLFYPLVVFWELVGSRSRGAFFLFLLSWKDQCPHSWPSFVGRGRRQSQEWESKFQRAGGHGERAEGWGGWPLPGVGCGG